MFLFEVLPIFKDVRMDKQREELPMAENEIMKEIEEFTAERDWDQFHTPENLAKSIAIESGELLECFQWSDKYDINDVKGELADVMNYCLLLCSKLHLDPDTILREKMEETAKKYPVEKCKGKSTKYNKL